MRLTEKEVQTIREETQKIFGTCRIYLFGSRVDHTKLGGDIDLYVVPSDTKDIFRKKLLLRSRLEDMLYKPIDVVVSVDKKRRIEQEAIDGGVLL